jgi:hypothetical protein
MTCRYSKIIEANKARARHLMRRAFRHLKITHSLYWYVRTDQSQFNDEPGALR